MPLSVFDYSQHAWQVTGNRREYLLRETQGVKMPRYCVLGNGNMLINYSNDLMMREVYYPQVGQQMQCGSTGHSTLIWCDGRLMRLADLWPNADYKTDSLVLEILAKSDGLGLTVSLSDAVHFERNVFCRVARVENHSSHARHVRIYMAFDCCLEDNDIGDTAMLDPHSGGIIHFKANTFMLVNGFVPGGPPCQRTTGVRPNAHVAPDTSDASDGTLSEKPTSQGAVYSIIGITIDTRPNSSGTGYLWFSFGKDMADVRSLDSWVKSAGPDVLVKTTEEYWRSWLSAANMPDTDLPEEATSLYKRSLLTVRVECDNRGGILAANDRDMLEHGRDHYSYVWPRDGALVGTAMLRAGFYPVARRFLEFCARHVTDDGFLWQRYRPDGTLGSTWHPWVEAGNVQMPIQEDETALAVWAMGRYIRQTRDLEFLKTYYRQYGRMADFLVSHIHEPSGLPLPSHDLWEERRGVFSFTVASIAGALEYAAMMAGLLGHSQKAAGYLEARRKISNAWQRHLFDADHGRFARGAYLHGNEWSLDLTPDSSLHGIWMFGLLDLADLRLSATLDEVESGLFVHTSVNGIARYTGDYYHRRTDDIGLVPGNPWLICTLWAASRRALQARDARDKQRSRDLLMWALAQANKTGMLPEQLDPFTREPLSVSPLTWSHAEYINAYLDYAESHARKDANTTRGGHVEPTRG